MAKYVVLVSMTPDSPITCYGVFEGLEAAQEWTSEYMSGWFILEYWKIVEVT